MALKGVEINETANEVIITFRKDGEYGFSKSGGNPVVASTGGFVMTPSGIRLSLNAIR